MKTFLYRQIIKYEKIYYDWLIFLQDQKRPCRNPKLFVNELFTNQTLIISNGQP